MADVKEEHIPLNFIYTGVVYTSHGLGIEVIPINQDGGLGDAGCYSHKKSREYAIGGIYSGATFSGTSARGLDSASYQSMYGDKDAIIGWKARNDLAKSKERTAKLEKDSKKINEIDNELLHLRKLYATYRKRNDRAGMDALESAVISSLRTPLRQSELK